MEAGGCRTEILDDADAIGLWEGEAVALVRALWRLPNACRACPPSACYEFPL